MSATIQDITAFDSGIDSSAGDIRNARVTFVDRENGDAPINAMPLPVALVDPADITVGTVIYTWENVDIGNNDSDTFEIGIVVSHYFHRDEISENSLVTIAKPLDNFVSGGGFIVVENSAGILAGDAGTKANFSVGVKFNKKGKNIKGKFSILVRRTESDGILHTYRIKSNKLDSLGIDPNTDSASLDGKANVQDVTDPDNPISVSGNKNFRVDMQDNGNPGSQDLMGITLFDSNGALYFSSNWSGVDTSMTLLGGGNIKVNISSGGGPSAVTSPGHLGIDAGGIQIHRIDDGIPQIMISPSAPGFYLLETSDDLIKWSASNVPGPWGPSSVIYLNSTEDSEAKFYRLRLKNVLQQRK